MGQLKIFQKIEAEIKRLGYRCRPRGSLAGDGGDVYSDIDLSVAGDQWDVKKVEEVLASVAKVAGVPVDIRFDADEEDRLLFTVHSYLLPILWRIDVMIEGQVDPRERVKLMRKYPWYTHWHEVMRQAYKKKAVTRRKSGSRSSSSQTRL